MRILGRDPALVLGFVSAVLQMLVAFGLSLTDAQTATINAAAAAVLGVVTAFAVARDRIVPSILGFGQAAFTLALAFGAEVSQEQVAASMAAIAAVLALFVRTQVTAAVDADGQPVPKQPIAGP